MLEEFEELKTKLSNIKEELDNLPTAHTQRDHLCRDRDATRIQLDCIAMIITGSLCEHLILNGKGIYSRYAFITGQYFCGIKGKEITLDEPNEGMLPGEKPKTDANTVWLH